ncbi:MAG TPA: hypothetical protein VMT05_04845 [Terriglobales bacterium]|nr:hypothetical protein [Terriglobales bacterium]
MATTPALQEEVFRVQDFATKLSFGAEDEIPDQTAADLAQEEFDALVNDVAAMKDRLSGHHTFKQWFATRVDTILKLRSRFPENGNQNTRVEVRVAGHNPEEVTWEEFVNKYLGITPQYLNRLIHAVKIRQRNPGPTKKKASAKDLLIERLQEEVKDLRSQIAEQEESPADIEAADAVEESPPPGQETETAEADEEAAPEDNAWEVVLAHFREYCTAPAAFAEELRSLIREFGLTRKISVEEI